MKSVGEIYAELAAKNPQLEVYLSVCCGREQLSSSASRFCQFCGKEVRGERYRPSPPAAGQESK